MSKENKERHYKLDLVEEFGEEIVVFSNPGYEDAIIGVSHDNRAVYSYDKMIKWLCETDSMTPENAADYISYNSIGALCGDSDLPIVVYDIYDE